jgi:hypothetical protein
MRKNLFSKKPDVNAVIALVAGVLILIKPSLLSYVVAVYLIVVGLTGVLRGR